MFVDYHRGNSPLPPISRFVVLKFFYPTFITDFAAVSSYNDLLYSATVYTMYDYMAHYGGRNGNRSAPTIINADDIHNAEGSTLKPTSN